MGRKLQRLIERGIWRDNPEGIVCWECHGVERALEGKQAVGSSELGEHVKLVVTEKRDLARTVERLEAERDAALHRATIIESAVADLRKALDQMTERAKANRCAAETAAPLDPQPPPLSGVGDVWAEIIATLPPGRLRDLCIERRQQGIDRYGVPLQRGNGRDFAVDAGQEALDKAAYLAGELGPHHPRVRAELVDALELLGGGQ